MALSAGEVQRAKFCYYNNKFILKMQNTFLFLERSCRTEIVSQKLLRNCLCTNDEAMIYDSLSLGIG